jgi:type II secretory pathway predicted ATPase ExeA
VAPRSISRIPSAQVPSQPVAPKPIPAPLPAAPVQPTAPVARPAPPLPLPPGISLPQPPPWLPPSAFAAVSAASAALSAAFDSPESDPEPAYASPPPALAPQAPGVAGGAPRTLLDLFPPAVSRDATAPSLSLRETSAPPSIASMEPPRIAVPRRTYPTAAPAPGATYETFYGLDEKPFAADPDLRFLYHSGAHDRVLQDLAMSVGRRDAVVVFTGEPGIGKTMLCRALVDQLDRRTLVSFPAGTATSADGLLKTLLVDFGVISPSDAASGRIASAAHADLSKAIHDFIASLAVLQASALLIVDDAHTLPGPVLKELCALSELAMAQRLLQIVLVGEPGLTRLLRTTDLRALDERVNLRIELGPLDEDEVPGYVAHRLAVAGRGERVDFGDAALRKVFTLTGGVPRVVNQICDRAMTLGYQVSASRIDGDLVEQAAQELELVPAAAASSWRDRALIAGLMILMMLAGAAGAGFVFREPLKRAWTQWHGGGPSAP